MGIGDRVAYKPDPGLYGKMIVVGTQAAEGGTLFHCRTDDVANDPCGPFRRQELAPSTDYFVTPVPFEDRAAAQ